VGAERRLYQIGSRDGYGRCTVLFAAASSFRRRDQSHDHPPISIELQMKNEGEETNRKETGISAQRPSLSTFRLAEHLSCQQLDRASSFSTASG
jgi:hypothetical protein